MRLAEPYHEFYFALLDTIRAERREAQAQANRWGWGLEKRLNRWRRRLDRLTGRG